MKTLTLILALIFSQLSHATGETDCQMENDTVIVTVFLGNSHYPGFPVLGGGATVEFKNSTTPPITYTKSELVGWWNHNGELNMHFYKESATGEYITDDLVITTTYSESHNTHLGMVYYNATPSGVHFQEIISCMMN